MALHLPSEIIVERFLPTARAMLASELDSRELTQQAIADRLGVTQAAVSKYISGDSSIEPRFRDEPRMHATIERIADGFIAETMGEYEALNELLLLIREFEDRGPICAIHEEEMPALQGLGCDLCVRGLDTNVREERNVLASVRKAARIVAETPTAVDYIPNVGTNIGMALPNATDQLDVAAIPGRIHAMRGRVNIPSDPEFGASQHVATTILTAMTVDPRRRGAINVAPAEELLNAASERGIDPLAFDAAYEDRTGRLKTLFNERNAVPRIIYHDGDFGIEPIMYILGETAIEAAELARELITAVQTTPE